MTATRIAAAAAAACDSVDDETYGAGGDRGNLTMAAAAARTIDSEEERTATPLSPTLARSQQIPFRRRPRLIYFSTFCWISICGGRFLAPFLEQACGLSSTWIGVALAVQQVVSTATGPLGGTLADAQQRNENACANSGGIGPSVATATNRGRAKAIAVGIIVGTVITLLHAVPVGALLTTNATFATVWHIGLRIGYALSSSLIFPVLDGMTVDFLKTNFCGSANNNGDNPIAGENTEKSEDDYGKERLYGAVSWAATNLALSPLLDTFGFAVVYPFTVLSCIAVLISLHLHVSDSSVSFSKSPRYQVLEKRSSDIILPDDNIEMLGVSDDYSPNDKSVASATKSSTEKADQEQCHSEERPHLYSTLDLLRVLVSSSRCGVSFLFCLFCLSSGTILVEFLVFLFFEFLGGSYQMMGWTVVLTVLFEIPIFHIAPLLLRKFGGSGLLLLACLCYTTRVVGYSLVPEGHAMYILLLEPLHGITYACGQTAMVDFVVNANLPQGYEASGQGLVQLFKGSGSTIGLLLGGWAEDSVGPRVLYRVAAGVVASGAAVLVSTIYANEGSNLPTTIHSEPVNSGDVHCALPQRDDHDDIELT